MAMLLWFSVLEQAGNGISIVLLIFTILEFCIAVATALFWCRATRLNSHEVSILIPWGCWPAPCLGSMARGLLPFNPIPD